MELQSILQFVDLPRVFKPTSLLVMSVSCVARGHESMRQKVCSLFNSEFISYNFCLDDGIVKWNISKRYSDFRDLDQELAKRYPKRLQGILRLPPKKYVNNLGPALVEYRQNALDSYLKSLLHDKALLRSHVLREFLEMPLEATLLSGLDDLGAADSCGGCDDSRAPTEASQADTSPRSVGIVTKVKSWQDEAEAKWGDLNGDLLNTSADDNGRWGGVVAGGDLLSPR